MTDDTFLIENGFDLGVEVDFPLTGRDKSRHCQDDNKTGNRQLHFIVPEHF
jgi:hypothetical protein